MHRPHDGADFLIPHGLSGRVFRLIILVATNKSALRGGVFLHGGIRALCFT